MARRNFAQILREAGISYDDEYSRLYEWFMEQENIFYMGLDTLYEKFVKVTLWYLNTEELVPR